MGQRVIAFDLGEKRIGVAVSDPTGTIAEGRETIQRSGSSVPWRVVLEAVAEAGADRAVVGDPLSLDGSVGRGSLAARDFAEQLGKRAGIPVDLQDERLTSVAAERALRERPGGREKKRRRREAGETDRMAAVLILQAFLDRRASAPEEAS